VDLDGALTVLAQGCYRWLGRPLRPFDEAAPKHLYRKFIETGGAVEVRPDRVLAHVDRRAHNPILREARRDRQAVAVPWLQGLPLVFEYA
jgi:hypothetical protein